MYRTRMETPVPYEVACMCGRPLRGQRRSSRQIVPCPSCGRKRLILPSSPWLATVATQSAGQAARFNLKRLLLIIVGGCALGMTLIFWLVRPYLRRTRSVGDSRALLAEGERQLRQGNIFLAHKALEAALEQSSRPATVLRREEHHRLEQLLRQTDLLARLLDQPLEEMVHQAKQHRSGEEWRAKFEHYRGRTVVFDDVVRRDHQGRPTLGSYVIGESEARVALENLTLLWQLPLDPPRRWLFGARLADCRRETGGIWVFRFEPDSAVLFSDEITAAVCCPVPLDEQLLAVLKRQDEWLRH